MKITLQHIKDGKEEVDSNGNSYKNKEEASIVKQITEQLLEKGIKPEEIRKLAQEAGFENIEFFSDYNMESFNPETSQNILCILS